MSSPPIFRGDPALVREFSVPQATVGRLSRGASDLRTLLRRKGNRAPRSPALGTRGLVASRVAARKGVVVSGVSTPGAAQAETVHQAGTLGAALRYLRARRGISLRVVAPRLNLSFAELSRIERDLKPAGMGVAHAAEEFFATELAREEAQGYLATLTAAAASPPSAPARGTGVALPPPPIVLVGREQEQAELRRALARPGVVTVDGLAGVGKTALVLAAAHAVAGSYRDGVLIADAADATEQDVPHRILGQWLVTLGHSAEQISEHVQHRSEALIQALRGKHVLLVLENIADPEQVRPFLPAVNAGCTLVVTSHRRLRGLAMRTGAARLSLSPLAPATGAQLLRALLGPGEVADDEEQQLQDIARLCGGLPLALQIAAEHLAQYTELHTQELLAALQRQEQRLDVLSDVTDPSTAVRAVLHRPYESLDAAHRWLFRVLGLHGGPVVTVQGAAALTGQDRDTVQRGLQVLSEAHLLEPSQPGRWRWHPLLQLLAGELVRRDESPYQRLHAVRRWVSWYLRLATQARSATSDEEHDRLQQELDVEAVNLPAVTATAVAHEQGGLVRQLMTLLDEIGRSDLAQRCEPTPPAGRRPTVSWVSTQTPDGRYP